VRVQRERTNISTGKITTETAYYIGSNEGATAESAGLQIRRHWSIESAPQAQSKEVRYELINFAQAV
jgi:hypothetical protein